MSQKLPPQINRVMNPAQFDQIVAAIAAHKYSWACVLILQFAGYNPLQYIPHRTYNRIVRDNHSRRKREQDTALILQDLAFDRDLKACDRQVKGGWQRLFWF